jgi:Sodium/hydrogen exchanger family
MQQLVLLHAISLIDVGDTTQQNVQLLVLLLVITLVVALISRPLRLPYTLVLVVVGLIIGISPLLPDLRLNPDVVLFLFLPVLLFEGAWSVDVKTTHRQLARCPFARCSRSAPLCPHRRRTSPLDIGASLVAGSVVGSHHLANRSDCRACTLASDGPLRSAPNRCGRGELVQRWG